MKRGRARMRRAARRFSATASPLRVLTVLACVVAGFMMAVSALASRGDDLRPGRTTELSALVATEADRADELARRAAELRAEVDVLTRRTADLDSAPPGEDLQHLAELADSSPVRGPALTVTLTDAPANVSPAGVDEDLLVVHQQDIQAVVNALWAGGAEAMTIQGQRVSSRTGIKCVGNTVVLHNVPYAPPYVITAVGDRQRMRRALDDSDYLDLYREYVRAYRLGYAVEAAGEVTLPGYEGPAEVRYARQR
ncbi:MAG: DUF881 domain-containing protein [Propioniciclava sp.]